jgi:hypothetical protein
MSSVSNSTAIELFKKVYGETHDLVPKDQILSNDIEWSDGNKVGDEFKEDVILGDEVGWTLGGSGQDAFEINPAIAGAVKQTSVTPYVTMLPSILPFATISRSLSDEESFMRATQFITKNNLKSHERLQETLRFYGQSAKLLGYQSYATATYRGVSLTNGGGTINSIAFTGGANTASKAILFKPGDFASGIWVGRKGARVAQVDSTGAIAASGKLVSVNSRYGYITVDFTPVAATAASGAGSYRMAFVGQESTGEMVGIHKILSTSGTLFGINNSTYELFAGNQKDCESGKLTLARLQIAIADAVNGGGLDGDLVAYVNPRTWATINTTEAALRVYDKSYSTSKAENGFMDIEYYSQNGRLTVKAHRHVMEGDAFVLKPKVWKRSGSAQPGFKVPGMDQDLIKPLENQAGFQFKSYADEYVFTAEPAQNIYLYGINDESAA